MQAVVDFTNPLKPNEKILRSAIEESMDFSKCDFSKLITLLQGHLQSYLSSGSSYHVQDSKSHGTSMT